MRRGLHAYGVAGVCAAGLFVLAGCGSNDEGGFVSTSGLHTCAVHPDGSLECWGMDDGGSVDDPNGSSDMFSQVAVGDEGSAGGYTCGLRVDGRLVCWGGNPTALVAGASTDTFTQIAGGEDQLCGVKAADKHLECFGDDDSGEVDGPNASTNSFVQVATDDDFTCGVRTNGRLQCWGDDADGKTSGPNASTATFAQLSTESDDVCGLKTTGRLQCWGYDGSGQVTGANTNGKTFAQVSVGGGHICGRRTSGRLLCWGADQDGQSSGPSASTDLFNHATAGAAETCGLKTNGRIMCWGFDNSGSVDDPNASNDAFGFPPAQLGELGKLIDSFQLKTSLPRTLKAYIDKANAALAKSDVSGACKAVKSLRSTAADAGGRLSTDQKPQVLNAADGIRAALGCA